ncbi:MAG TPA: hypothetical protein VKG01_21240 [Thermoanaerobaculia bacterium]|nr:hypothetical protein [Thermoanaerobaculia bacterium]
MERFDRKDLRFVAICLLVMVAGGAVTLALFRRAFPEASIEFRVNRDEARALAEKHLRERGHDIAKLQFAGRFAVDEEPKVYLERVLGLEKASAYYGKDAKVWLWQMRWFQSGVKEEERVTITPLGDLAAFDSVRKDDAAGPRPAEAEARAIAESFLSARGLTGLKPIEATPVSRPNRTDWNFVHERSGFLMGEATVRFRTSVSGGAVTGYREFVHVPEAWTRAYEKLRSKNNTANLVGNFALFLTFLAMIGVLVTKIVRKDIPWKLVAGFGATAFVLSLLSIVNGIPLSLYQYDTASPLSGHLAKEIILGVLGAVGVGASIALIVASSEPIYRERFPGHVSLPGLFSRRGLRSKSFFRGLILGYAMTAFFFAYQAIFYVVAEKLGAWAPAEIPYDDILNTALPWATVLFIGFLPAVLEEGSSRLFSISFLDRLGAGRFLAVVLPAFIWGFNHAAYPNQPFYIRGLEVGFAGVAIGFLMLRFGALPLLVWHFTVDALYTALLLLRSGNTYYLVTGAAASLILLLPLAISIVAYRRRGGFEPAAGLTNADLGFVPAPAPAPTAGEPVAAPRSVRRGVLGAFAAAAVVLGISFFLPSDSLEDEVRDATGRTRAREIARAFLSVNGVEPGRFHQVAYLGTGFADDDDMREANPPEHGGIPTFSEGAARYVLSKGGAEGLRRLTEARLPLDFWLVRFFQAEKKEEWKVLVDTRRSRVIGFVNPKEEAAPAPPAPSAEEAKRRAVAAAAKLGYPADSYKVVDVGTQNRPKRTDTTVMLESRPPGVGDAWPRIRAVFHGGRLASLLPSVRVPEEFQRAYRKRPALSWVLLGAKIVAIGGIVGIVFLLFLRIVRAPEFRWKSLLVPIAVVAPLAALGTANGFPVLLRAYTTQIPLTAFRFSIGIALLIGLIVLLVAFGMAFVLFSGARPGWRRARRAGSVGDAVARAVVAAAILAALARLESVVAARFPGIFSLDPSLPSSLETAVPAYSVLWSALRTTVAFAAAAAVAGLALGHPVFRKASGKALAVLMVVVAILPGSVHSASEFVVGFLTPAVSVAALAAVAFGLLRDHVGAWVLFGAISYGGRAAAALLEQPAETHKLSGLLGLALVLLAAVAVVAGRRAAGMEMPAPAPPAPPNVEGSA